MNAMPTASSDRSSRSRSSTRWEMKVSCSPAMGCRLDLRFARSLGGRARVARGRQRGASRGLRGRRGSAGGRVADRAVEIVADRTHLAVDLVDRLLHRLRRVLELRAELLQLVELDLALDVGLDFV